MELTNVFGILSPEELEEKRSIQWKLQNLHKYEKQLGPEEEISFRKRKSELFAYMSQNRINQSVEMYLKEKLREFHYYYQLSDFSFEENRESITVYAIARVYNEQIPRDQEKLDYLEKKEQRLLSKFIKATDLRTSADYKLEEGVLYFRYGQYDSTQSLPGNWVWDEWKRAGKHSLMADILEMIKQEEEFSIKGIM
jgi:hypothetical protein